MTIFDKISKSVSNDDIGVNTGNAVGGTDTYRFTAVGFDSVYKANQIFLFKADVANVGPCSVNVTGSNGAAGTVALVKPVTTVLVANEIKANQLVICAYDGTNMQIVGGGGGGDTNYLVSSIATITLSKITYCNMSLMTATTINGSYIAGAVWN